jgi:hypothetical protein
MGRVGSNLPLDLRASWVASVPSLWFLGLYDVLGGRAAAGSPSLARIGALATITSVVAATGLFVVTHARLTRMALESRELPRRRLGLRALKAAAAIIALRPVAKATFAFTLQSLVRSRSHRLLLSGYVGVALALVASAVVPIALSSGVLGFASPRMEILSAPLVIGFFTLVGIRIATSIPTEPRANWVFRLDEPVDRHAAISGVIAAMLAAGVLPSSLIAFSSAWLLWGAWPAIVHATVCFCMGWLLIEILLLRLDKIPFTCTYFPGKSRIRTLWPLYLTGFITYCYRTPVLELRLMQQPSSLAVFAVICTVILAVFWFMRRRRLSALSGFRFEEEDPNTMFEGFHLSEGLAAQMPESERR